MVILFLKIYCDEIGNLLLGYSRVTEDWYSVSGSPSKDSLGKKKYKTKYDFSISRDAKNLAEIRDCPREYRTVPGKTGRLVSIL